MFVHKCLVRPCKHIVYSRFPSRVLLAHRPSPIAHPCANDGQCFCMMNILKIVLKAFWTHIFSYKHIERLRVNAALFVHPAAITLFSWKCKSDSITALEKKWFVRVGAKTHQSNCVNVHAITWAQSWPHLFHCLNNIPYQKWWILS